jgi:glucosamine--fructose-6-phosphate aminotransferase (isomerizing)
MGVVNTVGSLIATNVRCGVYLHVGREVAVAATKSFICQIIALIMMAISISYHKHDQARKTMRKEIKTLLRQLPICFGEAIRSTDDEIKKVAKVIHDIKTMIIIGKGLSGLICKEGALKLKELTYIHCEAFVAGELKHGPIALINSDEPGSSKIILMILDDEHFHDMELALSEVKSRNAHTIVITDCSERLTQSKCDHIIEIPSLKWLTPLLGVVVFQKLANEICIINNVDPDKPRNLAKTVTVG